MAPFLSPSMGSSQNKCTGLSQLWITVLRFAMLFVHALGRYTTCMYNEQDLHVGRMPINSDQSKDTRL